MTMWICNKCATPCARNGLCRPDGCIHEVDNDLSDWREVKESPNGKEESKTAETIRDSIKITDDLIETAMNTNNQLVVNSLLNQRAGLIKAMNEVAFGEAVERATRAPK